MTTAASMPPHAGPGGDLVLDVRNVTLRFGGLTSLDDVSLQHQRGEVLAVIGPNGAGKTSLFNCLTGVYTPQSGSVTFRPATGPEQSVLGRKPFAVNQMGIARTFQNIRLFNALTALENVKIGIDSHHRTGPVGAMLRLPRARREENVSDQEAMRLLDFVGLGARANQVSSSLPYGDQRRLEIARALGTKPQVLLLDEPAAGTNPFEKRQLETLIRQIADSGVSVLLIEHDMKLVMSVAAKVVVLNFGHVIASGTPSHVQRDAAVVEAYLGSSTDTPDTKTAPKRKSTSKPRTAAKSTPAAARTTGAKAAAPATRKAAPKGNAAPKEEG